MPAEIVAGRDHQGLGGGRVRIGTLWAGNHPPGARASSDPQRDACKAYARQIRRLPGGICRGRLQFFA